MTQGWLVFIEGLLSFFSPCVLPLLPLYMAYLGYDMKNETKGWKKRFHVFGFTLLFVLGICTVFVIAAFSAEGLSTWLTHNRLLVSLIGGLLIILFGLFHLGLIQVPILMKEFRFTRNKTLKEGSSLIQAYLMGFLFSFSWTPCIGPMLSSVFIAGAASGQSIFLIFCYGLGFVIPFLILGLFTEEILGFLQKKKNLLPYAIKLGGILMIVMGLTMSVPAASSISKLLSSQNTTGNVGSAQPKPTPSSDPQVTSQPDQQLEMAADFTLQDQNGETHTLSDYQGKVVFLHFWATWCGYCKAELPTLQKLLPTLPDDVVVLTLVSPGGNELSKQGIMDFVEENGYTFPVLFDEDTSVFTNYAVNSFPMTYMINAKGELYGYAPGALDEATMLQIIDMARNNTAY